MMQETAPNNNKEDHSDSGAFGDEGESTQVGNSLVDPNKEVKEVIGKKEDRAVVRLRLLVLLVLLAALVGVAVGVYTYLDNSEKTAFQDQFDSDATKVLKVAGDTLDNTLGPADAFIVNLVAHSRTIPKRIPNQSTAFPYVTMPSFGLQATKMLRNSKGFQIWYGPVVQPDQLEEWKKYANETHKQWIDEALAISEGDPEYDGVIYKDYKSCYDVYTWGGKVLEKPRPDLRYFLPKFMEFPVATGLSRGNGCPYNFDMSRATLETGLAFSIVRTQRKALIGGFSNVNLDPNDPVQKQQLVGTTEFYKTLLPADEDPFEPVTTILIPVFDEVDSVYLDQNDTANPLHVGNLGLHIQFKAWIRNILPDNSNGIIVVLSPECENQKPFTYRIDGAEAIYLGVGDNHDPKYDDMVYTEYLHALAGGTTYTGVPLSPGLCAFRLNIYPSQDMEDNHRTNMPIAMAFVAAGIFAFTSAVFLTYDYLVAKRQKVVMGRALESGAIVQSLFPEEVAQKLYEENKAKVEKEEKQLNFMSSGEHPVAPADVADSNQIAQLHPDCTVFFADLAGFTSWSSQRQPSEVFLLLETLYGAFDKIADTRRVFKIETIGDCYVAITGCPKPQKNNASIMCRFANDCMSKMTQITAELADKLGEDTATLGFRVGLHSGPVTAGVLRGRKARFQLFGDTVNTAARMESNGVKGKIHVSEATANALIASGKESWLTMREDKIVAKGKGEMQTFFVTVRAGNAASMTSYITSTSSWKDEVADLPSQQKVPDKNDDLPPQRNAPEDKEQRKEVHSTGLQSVVLSLRAEVEV